MIHRDRYIPGVLIAISMIALVILAGGLSQTSLRPSSLQPIRYSLSLFDEQAIPAEPLPALLSLIRDGIVILSIAILPIAILYLIFSREAKTRVLRYFLLLMLNTAVFVILLPRIRPAELEPLELPLATDLSSSQNDVLDNTGILSLPDGILYGVVFLVVSALLLLTWFLIGRFQKRGQVRFAIAENARTAIRQVQSGRRFEDAVVHCYYEMCRTLDARFGLERRFGTTPREFEAECIQLGLPEWAVIQLTRLFEEIRYGRRITGNQDQVQALACLQAISEAGR